MEVEVTRVRLYKCKTEMEIQFNEAYPRQQCCGGKNELSPGDKEGK